MKRKDTIKGWIEHGGVFGVRQDVVYAELRALWAVYDEYADAIEQLGGTLPPALDAYDRGDP